MADAPDARKVSVIFSEAQLQQLQRLADEKGVTQAEALRQALEVGTLVLRAKADGGTRILFKRGNDMQELQLAS